MKNGYYIKTIENAPEGARPMLSQVQDNLGFVPNGLAAMANSPVVLSAFLQLGGLLPQTSFTDTERHVLYLAVTREYDSEYCVSAHTAFAHMDKVDDKIVQQLREGQQIDDERLEALRQFAIRLVQTGCNVDEEEVKRFLKYGYSREQVLEIVLIIAHKIFGVFTNRIMGTDLDEALQPLKWSKVA